MVDLNDAINIAKEALTRAYAPYSNYKVGAALVSKNDKIYSGCNIENHGIMSICAERVAFTKAISEGDKDFSYIVICGGKSIDDLDDCVPCGYCRQFMSEFIDKDFIIYTIGPNEKIKSYTISDLLPNSFGTENLM